MNVSKTIQALAPQLKQSKENTVSNSLYIKIAFRRRHVRF